MRAQHTLIFHVYDTPDGFRNRFRQIQVTCPQLGYFEGTQEEGYVIELRDHQHVVDHTGQRLQRFDFAQAAGNEGANFVLEEQSNGRLAVAVKWTGMEEVMPALLRSIAEWYPECRNVVTDFLHSLTEPTQPLQPLDVINNRQHRKYVELWCQGLDKGEIAEQQKIDARYLENLFHILRKTHGEDVVPKADDPRRRPKTRHVS